MKQTILITKHQAAALNADGAELTALRRLVEAKELGNRRMIGTIILDAGFNPDKFDNCQLIDGYAPALLITGPDEPPGTEPEPPRGAGRKTG